MKWDAAVDEMRGVARGIYLRLPDDALLWTSGKTDGANILVLMREILVFALALLAAPLFAHPGVGIVGDARGNIYYTDLEHVWCISPSGEKSNAVPNVHTHELALDASGNLHGEDSQFLGGDRWRRRFWRRSPGGVVTITVPWHTGYPRQHGVVRDRSGATYWVDTAERKQSHIFRRRPGGAIEGIAPGAKFGHPMNWLATTENGLIYAADGVDLKKVDAQGRTTTVVRRLAKTGQNHALGGLFVAAGGDVYAAVPADNVVARVTPNGRVSVVERSTSPWSPWGVFVDSRATVWILEYSSDNRARVRNRNAAGHVKMF